MQETPALGQAWYGPFFGDGEIAVQRIRMAYEMVGEQIARGLARIFNAYCDQHGIGVNPTIRCIPSSSRPWW